MNNFTITPYSLEDIGAHGQGTIYASVKGYWSTQSISLYVSRRGYGLESTEWAVSMSHGSGGRDPNGIVSDMEAAINFADAMRELALIGRDLVPTYGDTLESCYQAEKVRRAAEYAAELAAEAAKVEADPAMGHGAAASIVQKMVDDHLNRYISYYMRGSVKVVRVSVQHRDKTKFYVNGQVTAKKAVIEKLAGLSCRETFRHL